MVGLHRYFMHQPCKGVIPCFLKFFLEYYIINVVSWHKSYHDYLLREYTIPLEKRSSLFIEIGKSFGLK